MTGSRSGMEVGTDSEVLILDDVEARTSQRVPVKLVC
jgi:hypothetical protein